MTADPPHLPPTDEALDELTDSLTARFPATRDEVAAIVRRAYEQVSADSPVDAYLVHLTEGKAGDELRARYPAHH
ncbi:three-helix bundle dimerization domain-containing protein [Amycolatopsis samaneae]|uniref:Three-helix bundle dimerization domain-containing protein n=1 Tax=Amycolatopsis samaneae TaxID=664691 RepID=A0ABW5GU41_9PSEU